MTERLEHNTDVRRRVAEARAKGLRVGLVPTMGALHEGHASLIRAARADGGLVVVSIFVNPTQFGPGEDLAKYPRPIAKDMEIAGRAGADVVFNPAAEEMYQAGFATTIHVTGLTEKMCGASRPGHFDGVCTVVAKLLQIVRPDVAYFGEKDAQQLAVVRRMAADLDFGVEIRGCPLVRDADGLALSSRNAYLSAGERRQALALSAALGRARQAILGGERDAVALTDRLRQELAAAPGVKLEYVAVVDPDSLAYLATIGHEALVAVAARVGTTRLIDNVVIRRLD
jgi:pantoate--beta-alanine ligase